jgi:hypothetical protein
LISTGPDALPTVYVDGIAGMGAGAAISHIEFFAIVDLQQDSDPNLGPLETREIKLRMTMPTLQFLEGFMPIC